jgi:hypothetical protein
VRTRRFAALILAVAAVLPGTAAAAAPVDIDHVSLGVKAQGNVSYGALGTPAEIDWSVWQPGPPKVYRVQTQGQLWVQGPNATMLCVRRKVTFKDAKGRVLSVQAPTNGNNARCLPANTGGGGAGSLPIWFDSAKVRKVRVALQQAASLTGPWTTVAVTTCVLGTTDCA